MLIRSNLKITALALCLATPAAAQDTTITVTATPSIFAPMFEALVESFEATNPDVRVELTIPPGEQQEMIQDLLRRALVDDLPDVTFQGYNHIRTLAERDLPVPLDAFIAEDAAWQGGEISSSVANSGTLDGTVYGLGLGFSFPVLYYNADLVNAALEGQSFPSDWAGVIDLANTLYEGDSGNLGGFLMSHSWIFQALVETTGNAYVGDDGRLGFAGDQGEAVFDIIGGFAEAGQAESAMTREQARQAFVGGTVGIFTDSSSVLARHLDQIGDRFELAVAPFPISAEGASVPAAGVAGVMLTRDEAKQDAAWRFLSHVVSAEGQMLVAQNTSYVPANAAALEASEDLHALLTQDPRMQAALDTAPLASAWYAFPGQNGREIDAVIADMMQAVTSGTVTPDQAQMQLLNEIQALR